MSTATRNRPGPCFARRPPRRWCRSTSPAGQFGYDLLDQLPDEIRGPAGSCGKILPFSFRSYRQELGYESIWLNDAVALAAVAPRMFEVETVAGDVELSGELTTGATVFDRRRNREWRTNLAVATKVDVAAARDCILRGIAAAGDASADVGRLDHVFRQAVAARHGAAQLWPPRALVRA